MLDMSSRAAAPTRHQPRREQRRQHQRPAAVHVQRGLLAGQVGLEERTDLRVARVVDQQPHVAALEDGREALLEIGGAEVQRDGVHAHAVPTPQQVRLGLQQLGAPRQ
jgi:hypothetical protein